MLRGEIEHDNSITSLVGNELEGYTKWEGCILGGDGYIYAIPYNDSHIIKFDTLDKSSIAVGEDLGSDRSKWKGGILANNNCIYCVPYCSPYILKYDIVSEQCTILNVVLPESGQYKWSSGALAPDGNIYFMPFFGACYILKLNPSNDSVCSVGIDLGAGGFKYIGTVVGGDGCVYGIPSQTNRIVKFDPRDQSTTFVGEIAEGFFKCGNGALARDGCIYAANASGHVLQIDIMNNNYSFVGNKIQSNHRYEGWRAATLGIDGYVYWPPCNANYTLKFDTVKKKTSMVGSDFGNGGMKWSDGVLAPDGAIYCIPTSAARVLEIDPMKELIRTIRASMDLHPEKMGLLFQKDSDGETQYDRAITKYGFQKTFEVIDKSITMHALCSINDLDEYSLVASCGGAISIIFAFMVRNPPILDFEYNT